MKKCVIFLFFVFFIAQASYAATYYVDIDTGSNSNDGSIGNPWEYAPGSLGESGWPNGSCGTPICKGDTIIFDGDDTWDTPINVTSSYYENPTQESERITFISDDTTTPKRPTITVNQTVNQAQLGFRVSRDYIAIQYFELGPLVGISTNKSVAVEGWADYTDLMYSYIHDVYTAGSNSFGIGFEAGGTGSEIAYNTFKNIEYKVISGPGTSTLIHHNVIYNEVDFIGNGLDHGIVREGNYQYIYNNIIWTDEHPGDNFSYAIKIDGQSNGSGASYARVYNNLILKWTSGIGILDTNTGGNTVAHNTIYLQDFGASGLDAKHLGGIVIRGDECGGCSHNNTVRNNIVYYPKDPDTGDKSACIYTDDDSQPIQGNTITNNLCYRTGSPSPGDDEGYYAESDSVSRTNTWMENSWRGVLPANGNTWLNNVIAAPGFSGGTHLVSNLPTGFDSNWYPNDDGLTLTVGSNAIDIGYTMGSPYDVDIVGVSRSAGSYDVGAYEYETSAEICNNGIDDDSDGDIDCADSDCTCNKIFGISISNGGMSRY